MGPQAGGVLTERMLLEMRGVLDVAIGVVLFQLGQRVDLGWLRRNPSLLATSGLEASLGVGCEGRLELVGPAEGGQGWIEQR